METLREILSPLATEGNTAALLLPYVTALTRLVLPILALIIVIRCGRSLLAGKNEPEVWAWLTLGDGLRLPINHWENIIGRGSSADILLPLPTISRNHAALLRDRDGMWTLIDLAHKDNIMVNGELLTDRCSITAGDLICIAGTNAVLQELTADEVCEQKASRTMPGHRIRPSRTLCWLSLFVLLLGGQLCLAQSAHAAMVAAAFTFLLLLMWLLWFISRGFNRRGFELETLGFFLSSLGLAVIASAVPGSLLKQSVALLAGLLCFIFLGWLLRSMRRIKTLRWPLAALALVLLGCNLLFGEIAYGARNWLEIAGISFQPSELVKIAFIFAGAATLDRLFARRNLYSFILLSAAIVGALALMSDFGTAMIFFVTFLVIAYLRSGDLATVALALASAGLAVVLLLTIKPYIAERFSAWRHVWEFASTSGYQQTRTMSAIASGGMFGLGGGQGWLKQIAASDTDLVFGFVCEEWGMIIALCAVAALLIAALFAFKAAYNARSAYYVIAACGTAALLLFQMMLNVFGSVDLLPLTGVTFPFISNGGSSLICTWGLLAFLKAADTRQNASFATSSARQKRPPAVNAPLAATADNGGLQLLPLRDKAKEDTHE